MIQQTFQQYAALKEDDCMVKFFETLKDFISYDEEVFPCELVVSSNLMQRDDTKQQRVFSPKSNNNHSHGFLEFQIQIYFCSH